MCTFAFSLKSCLLCCFVCLLCLCAENTLMVFATDASNGRILWKLHLSYADVADIALDGRNYLYAGGSTEYFVSP